MNYELLKRIDQAKANDLDKKHKEENARRHEEIQLREKIKALTPRIRELIDTANALIGADYFNEFLESFCSEGIVHRIGFIYNGECIESMGKVNGGALGSFDFHTTGEDIYMKYHRISITREKINWSNAKEFLEKFDDFESNFNSALEEFLKKKNA